MPELHEEAAVGRALVEIRIAAVPETLAGATATVAGLQVAGDEALLSIPGIARYLVRGGLEILVDPAPGASERDVRIFLLGSALGILCHQRGLLLLHANAIVSGGAAFAFSGASGAGKSTLAAYFERAGYPVLCDDVCGISFDPGGRPLAWPGVPRLRLWADAAQAFGLDPGALELAIEGRDKYYVPMAARARREAAPLERLYILERAEPEEAGAISRLHGTRAVEGVFENTYRGHYLEPLGLAQRHFRQCAALLKRIEVYAARRVWGYDVFDREAARLARHIGRAGADREAQD